MAWLDKRASGYYLRDRLPNDPSFSIPLGKISEREAERQKLDYLDRKDKGESVTRELGAECEAVLQGYINHFDSEGYSPKTKKTAVPVITAFLKPFRRVGEATPEKVKEYRDALYAFRREDGKGYAIDTIATRLRTLSAFCTWLQKERHVEKSPFQVSIPEGRKDAGRALEGFQVLKLFKCWPKTRIYNNRRTKHELSKLFYQIVFHGGCRLTELLGDENHVEHFPGLQHEDVIYDRLVIKLAKTKGGERREVALPKEVIRLIPRGVGPVFRGKIAARALAEHLMEALKAAGILGEFRTHDGRVSAATEWMRKHPDTRAAMDQFGWKSEKMAVHYNKVATERRVALAQNMTYED